MLRKHTLDLGALSSVKTSSIRIHRKNRFNCQLKLQIEISRHDLQHGFDIPAAFRMVLALLISNSVVMAIACGRSVERLGSKNLGRYTAERYLT